MLGSILSWLAGLNFWFQFWGAAAFLLSSLYGAAKTVVKARRWLMTRREKKEVRMAEQIAHLERHDDAILEIGRQVSAIAEQYQKNHGTSARDGWDRTEAGVHAANNRIDSIVGDLRSFMDDQRAIMSGLVEKVDGIRSDTDVMKGVILVQTGVKV